MSILGLWKEVPAYIFGRKSALPNGTINGEITPELLGVGYIIGPEDRRDNGCRRSFILACIDPFNNTFR